MKVLMKHIRNTLNLLPTTYTNVTLKIIKNSKARIKLLYINETRAPIE